MQKAIQETLNEVESDDYDAILLGYGLCNNGVMNLTSDLPMIIPRAHDCITLLLGSKERYKTYHDQNPDAYFKSSGWIEREVETYDNPDNVMNQLGISHEYETYVEQYGEENAKYLMSITGNWMSNYSKVTFIDTGVGNRTYYREHSKEYANENNWAYEELEGDKILLMKLLNGQWNDSEFITVPPTFKPVPSYGENIFKLKE